jgi:hypothetical protein
MLKLDDILKNRALGITIRQLSDSSRFDPSTSLNCLKLEHSSSKFEKKSLIKEFLYDSKMDECYISAIIDIPIRLKELIEENGSYRINERTINFPKDITGIIHLSKSLVFFFSRNRREDQRFSKYITQITLGGFRPLPIKFDQEKLKKVIYDFRIINHLKIFNENDRVSTTYKGKDLLSHNIIDNLLHDEDIFIYEIGGEYSLLEDNFHKLYLNHKGRVLIKDNVDILNNDDLANLLHTIEDMREIL